MAYRVFAGFDGFIDSIYRPLKKSGPEKIPFKTIAEFGNYIAGQANKGASIEMELLQRRMGGNMPNFVRAASALGAECFSVGMLSDHTGSMDPVFASLPGTKYSWTGAGQASALEFDDGKIFLAQGCDCAGDPWEKIVEKTGAALECMIRGADLIALVNWSELTFADSLWRSFYRYCVDILKPEENKFLIIDFCDMGRKSGGEIKNILNLTGEFSAFRRTIVSLNYNEALEAGAALGFQAEKDAAAGPDALAAVIRKAVPVNEVVIHTRTEALSLSDEGCFRVPVRIVEKPRISTGSGDTFNAAYGLASVQGLGIPRRLDYALSAARHYVSDQRFFR
ncbi:MAG: hypothetical protein LBI85_09410 [Spirochaetaceae bacterium]|jgi:hypothetical protein|nr:hypothetical protein [Spirochaetaceae bacterium]